MLEISIDRLSFLLMIYNIFYFLIYLILYLLNTEKFKIFILFSIRVYLSLLKLCRMFKNDLINLIKSKQKILFKMNIFSKNLPNLSFNVID